MSGSSFGKHFRVTTWGESHGEALGVVVDGVPAGITVDEAFIASYMERRKPGQSKYSTARKEGDELRILSGVFEGKTTGTPVSMVVFNQDQRSLDYSNIMDSYRPGHADYTFDQKYGFRDYRGGGRSSARETVARVGAGALAVLFLKELGIELCAYTSAIGPYKVDSNAFILKKGISPSVDDKAVTSPGLLYDLEGIRRAMNKNSLNMPDDDVAGKAMDWLDKIMQEHNSAGGVVECIAQGLPAGLGEPVFDKLDALLGQALFSLGAVKGVEIGLGFDAARTLGTRDNDGFTGRDGHITKTSNNAGGIMGGISDGSPLVIRAAIKPTPSVASPQNTVNNKGDDIELIIKGRHDPIIVPRAVVVVESMCALTISDLLLRNMSSRLSNVKKVYDR